MHSLQYWAMIIDDKNVFHNEKKKNKLTSLEETIFRNYNQLTNRTT